MIQSGRAGRIADEAVAGIQRQFRGLGFDVGLLDTQRIERRQVEAGKDVRQQQCRRPLRVRRGFGNHVLAVFPLDRLDVSAAGLGKILQRMGSSCPGQAVDHVLGDLTFIECPPSVARDPAQHLGLVRGPEQLPGRRRPSTRQIEPPGIALQHIDRPRPVERDPRCHRHAFLRVSDCRRETGFQAQPPPIRRKSAEGVNGAGDGYRVGRMQGNRIVTLGAKLLGCLLPRCLSGAVQGHNPVFAPRLQQHEAITADSGRLRLADPEQHRRRDRRVNRIAAILKQPDGNGCGQGVGGGAHPVGRECGRPAGNLKISHSVFRPTDGHRRSPPPCWMRLTGIPGNLRQPVPTPAGRVNGTVPKSITKTACTIQQQWQICRHGD